MWSKSLVVVFVLFARVVKSSTNQSESDARVLPPPPPFAPPLLYPVNAATGILVAIAVPVPLEEQNVFVSYNFEANYNMPNVPADSFPGKIDRFTLQNPTPFPIIYGDPAVIKGGTADDVIARKLETDLKDEETTMKNDTEKSHKIVERSASDRVIFTRRGAYHLLESRLNAYGINGKKCLLLAICDATRFSFIENNGVVGHVLHVILTPSSSADEKLPSEYTKAESYGKSGNCRKYEKHCGFNILDLFSKLS